MGSVGSKVSKEDWNQIIKGLECRPGELVSIPRAGFATCYGHVVMGGLLVSEVQPHHVLAP